MFSKNGDKSPHTEMPQSLNDTPKRLPTHEWFAIVIIIGLLFTLTLITMFSNNNSDVALGIPHHVVDQEIVVFIEGAVEKPGPYQVRRGTLVQDVVELAKPLPDANLKALKLERKVRKNQVIKVKLSSEKRRKRKKI